VRRSGKYEVRGGKYEVRDMRYEVRNGKLPACQHVALSRKKIINKYI